MEGRRMSHTGSTPDFTPEDLRHLQTTVERFAKQAIAPHVSEWEEAGQIDRALYTQASNLGLLGLGYPEHLGGTPAPWRARNMLSQNLARHGGSGGVMASLFSHNIGLPPLMAHGSAELQAEVVPPVLSGERIAALAITEPGGGSDVASLRTTARADGADYVIDGEKVFITSGLRADWITLAVRTDLDNKGSGGISMVMVPGDTPGISRTRLHKMGWHSSDTAQLHFNGVRVPQRYRLGAEGAGFKMIMGNFNGERLAMSAMALGFAQACFDEALAWARQRQTFGSALIERQVIRHKLMDMQMHISSTQAWVDAVTQQADAGQTDAEWVAQVCLLKNHATQTMQYCADAAVQMLGAMGYMRGTVSERVYREVKVMMIGGGAEEIMKELAAKQLRI
jgi:acyl-CoA dehydrogenase